MPILAQGAEAILERDGDRVIKRRIQKGYRHPEIDKALRKARTRREAKVIGKLPVPGPKLIATNNDSDLVIEYLDGERVVDILDERPELATEIGRIIGELHDASIIHGDLTTSNMILCNGKVHLIDFGLSLFSERFEDKAVDVHLFRQAIESRHFRIYKQVFDAFIAAYQPHHREQILQRLEVVEQRGKNKNK